MAEAGSAIDRLRPAPSITCACTNIPGRSFPPDSPASPAPARCASSGSTTESTAVTRPVNSGSPSSPTGDPDLPPGAHLRGVLLRHAEVHVDRDRATAAGRRDRRRSGTGRGSPGGCRGRRRTARGSSCARSSRGSRRRLASACLCAAAAASYSARDTASCSTRPCMRSKFRRASSQLRLGRRQLRLFLPRVELHEHVALSRPSGRSRTRCDRRCRADRR